MTKENRSHPSHASADDPALLGDLHCPGLTHGAKEVKGLADDLQKRLRAYAFKKRIPAVLIVFLGGTGTGKSTLFNAFCGETLSETGVERPITRGPVVFGSGAIPFGETYPFSETATLHIRAGDPPPLPHGGRMGKVFYIAHEREDIAHLLLADTPDVDSVEEENRRVSQDLYLLADAVVFVTSQEKYADDVPFRYLEHVLHDETLCFLLVNKVRDDFGIKEVLQALRERGLPLQEERLWAIPFIGGDTVQRIAHEPLFQDFKRELLTVLSPDGLEAVHQARQGRRAAELAARVDTLQGLLTRERTASRDWLEKIDALFQEVSQDLVREEMERFAEKSRAYLKNEIRRLFNRYDVLARPRRILRTLLGTPLRLLGLHGPPKRDARKEALRRVGERMDLDPVMRALDKFNTQVLKSLSPADEGAPLHVLMRQPERLLTRAEVKEHLKQEQHALEGWLEDTFERLTRDLPRTKRWGIYSTSIVWGILILSLETAVGGGFSILDAALDSALAPFVTKGAVELFAYQEIRRVASELSSRYQEGLISVLRLQKTRYEEALQSLLPSGKALEHLKALLISLQGAPPPGKSPP